MLACGSKPEQSETFRWPNTVTKIRALKRKMLTSPVKDHRLCRSGCHFLSSAVMILGNMLRDIGQFLQMALALDFAIGDALPLPEQRNTSEVIRKLEP